MEKQVPYADGNINQYAAAVQLQQIPMHRVQPNGGMSSFTRMQDSYPGEREHPSVPSKTEGQRDWDRDAPKLSNQRSSYLYAEGQVGNATRSQYHSQMLNPGDYLEKTNEQDMEIGYDDRPSPLTFETLEKKFSVEIMKLAKEQSDAEDAENVRHLEKIMEINNQYQEKFSALRALQVKRREEFLYKEAQERLYQYQHTGTNHYPTDSGPIDSHRCGPNQYVTDAGSIDPHGYGGGVPIEAHRDYAPGQLEPYRERSPFLQGERTQHAEARVPIPQGRSYNNTRSRNY